MLTELELVGSESSEEEFSQIEEYDLVSLPNDFNVMTVFQIIKSGAVRIPGFQRHYVWDLVRASKLIESLLLGLPVPQAFLYEESKNSFLVIDGQQRLMTIFYFMSGRFPRASKRSEIRERVDRAGGLIDDELLNDSELFEPFKLKLPKMTPERKNRFAGLSYETLGEYRNAFDMRTIRMIVVKQVSPKEDDSAIYEMFNRLNTGGVLLSKQEIRSSLYHSDFYDLMSRLNYLPSWRKIMGTIEPDLHLKDVEALLRLSAVADEGLEYKAPMSRFIDLYSALKRKMSASEAEAFGQRVTSVLEYLARLPRSLFETKSGKMSLPVLEAVFAVAMERESQGRLTEISEDRVRKLVEDQDFTRFVEDATTNKASVDGRLKLARSVL